MTLTMANGIKLELIGVLSTMTNVAHNNETPLALEDALSW
jgi:hypothetical protein